MINLLPAYATWQRFTPWHFLTYFLMHGSILIAPFTFTWTGLALFLSIYVITICGGVTLCYHRLLAHRSYKAPRWVRYALTTIALLTCQRGPIWWVGTHRLHHANVDEPLDPHTPKVSFFWSHMGWVFFRHPQLDENIETLHRIVPDLASDPGMRFLEKYYGLINVVFMASLYLIGYLLKGPAFGLSLFIWGGVFRVVATLHITWFVNSVAHTFGYRTYETPDTSRNIWWVALLTFGEGWHNNHHADQRAARNGHKWFEVDVTYYIILLMEKLGLATDVVPVAKKRLATIEINPELQQKQASIMTKPVLAD